MLCISEILVMSGAATAAASTSLDGDFSSKKLRMSTGVDRIGVVGVGKGWPIAAEMIGLRDPRRISESAVDDLYHPTLATPHIYGCVANFHRHSVVIFAFYMMPSGSEYYISGRCPRLRFNGFRR